MNYLNAKTMFHSVLYLQSLTFNMYPTKGCELMNEGINRWMNENETHYSWWGKIYISKCTPYFRPVASLYWKSNWLAKTINVMNYKHIGVFFFNPRAGGVPGFQGRAMPWDLKGRRTLSVSPLSSSCICFTLSLQIDSLISSIPLVKYGRPEFAAYSSSQTE